jgi:hypothetical protein
MQLFESMLDFETLRNIISRENFEIEQRSKFESTFVLLSVRPSSVVKRVM